MLNILENENESALRFMVSTLSSKVLDKAECLMAEIETKLKVIMVLAKKISKNITTTIPLLLEIKLKKKVQNFRNISGS